MWNAGRERNLGGKGMGEQDIHASKLELGSNKHVFSSVIAWNIHVYTTCSYISILAT